MALAMGQLSATSSPALSTSVVAKLCFVPSGVCTVAISNNSGATVFLGATNGTAPTAAALAADGFPIPSGSPPLEFSTWPGSTGVQLYVIATGTISAGMGWMISTAA